MTPGENGETVSMPHDVHRRAPIQCFLVLVLVNLMWAFQFSRTKIDDRAPRPNSRCLHPAAALDSAVCTTETKGSCQTTATTEVARPSRRDSDSGRDGQS